MRQSQRLNVLRVIGFRQKGILWRDLVGTHTYMAGSESGHKTIIIKVTRSTAARHLARLQEEGLIVKIPELRKEGERGRQPQRYKLAPCVEEVCHVPAKVITVTDNGRERKVPLFGFEKKNGSLKLFPHEKQIIKANPSLAKALKNDELLKRRRLYKARKIKP